MRDVNWSRALTVALGVMAGVVASVGLLAVAAGGFALSYDAIRSVAAASHIRSDITWMMPGTIDGSMAVATVTAVVMSRLGRSTLYPWCVVVAGALLSILCNAAHAAMGGGLTLPGPAAMAVSAIPAVELALSVHLLVMLVEAVGQRAAAAEAARLAAEEQATRRAAAEAARKAAPPAPPKAGARTGARPRARAGAGQGKGGGGKVERMYAHWLNQLAETGQEPSLADLDRVAGSSGLAKQYVRKWREQRSADLALAVEAAGLADVERQGVSGDGPAA